LVGSELGMLITISNMIKPNRIGYIILAVLATTSSSDLAK